MKKKENNSEKIINNLVNIFDDIDDITDENIKTSIKKIKVIDKNIKDKQNYNNEKNK